MKCREFSHIKNHTTIRKQLYFSNDLTQLIEIFKENLFSAPGAPFDRRMVIVPHLGLKNFLMRTLAKDPDLQVAAGIEIVNFSQAFAKMVKQPVPTTLELSLFLQHALLPLIEQEGELKDYFSCEAKEQRMGPFCDALARYFQRYGVFGYTSLPSWQQKLGAVVKKRFKFPKTTPLPPTNIQLHVFGASFIPKAYLNHYIQSGASLYLFSPCEIFWGDFYSAKEKQRLQNEMTSSQREIFASSFEDQNPLLSSWGKMGRQMFLMIEEANLITQEHYKEPAAEHCLGQLQKDLLSGTFSKPKSDESIQCVSASTRLREIEILKNTLLHLFGKKGVLPHQIQVLAPDISLYFPYIEALFSDIAYEISDLELVQLDPIAKAFKKLMALPKKRFSLESILQLFNTPPFREKFDLNVEKINKWLEAVHVSWGFSQKQRQELLLHDEEMTQIGTWEWGLKRLLLGLGDLKGVCAIAVTEMEMFNRLYTLMYSLADDLAPFYDGTKWTISTWLRYFCALLESYFVIDPTHDLYQELQRYSTALDSLDTEEVTFTSMERVVNQILHQKTKISPSAHLQALNFCSLSDGAIRPCEVLCLIGMEEEAFPGKEEMSSLCAKEQDYRPTASDVDRYLFLQGLMTPKQCIYMSYVRDPEGKLGASPLIDELLDQIDGGKISHHPHHPYDPGYFNGLHPSYNQEHYLLAQANLTAQKLPPLIKEFYEEVTLPSIAPFEKVDIQKLFKFARHPLRYFFHEVLGIYPERKWDTEKEYVLSPLTKLELVKEALHTPLDQVLDKAKERGELPTDLLIPLAREQILKELENWQQTLEVFGIEPKEIQTKIINFQVGSTHLQGKLELFTPQGLLVRGSDCVEDKVRFWPQALIMEKLGHKVLLIKDQKILQVEGSLDEYLSYFSLSHHVCSPLIPELAKTLLEKGDLKKALKNLEDECWAWLCMRDGTPNPEAIYQNWGSYSARLFGGVDAKV